MNEKWLDMLAGYASHHQHPTNIIAHIIGVPIIMFGMFIPMSWLQIPLGDFVLNGAMLAVVGLSVFYFSLDKLFALVFAVYASGVCVLATRVGGLELWLAGVISAATFFGGYALQFWGHAVEGKAPVLLKHPVQANISAPLFTIVEIFKLLGLREAMFNDMKARIARMEQAAA